MKNREKKFTTLIYMPLLKTKYFFSQPNGCLQYHTGIDGRITTFNWGGTQHLRNQNYRVCVRQEEGKD